MAFGNNETPFQISGLQVELTNNNKESQKQQQKLHSTGIHTTDMLPPLPFFINHQGQQKVHLLQGGWEIVWKPKSPHGHLICSFVVPETIQRNNNNNEDNTDNNNNSSKLTAGRFFMAHRVWTKESLASERQRRIEIQGRAAQFLKTRDDKIKDIMDNDNNNKEGGEESSSSSSSIGSKIVSYAQAAKAKNDYWTSGYQEALYIPLYDDQVVPICQNHCIVSTRGEIWKQPDTNTNRIIPTRTSRYPIKIGLSRVDFANKSDNENIIKEENSKEKNNQ